MPVNLPNAFTLLTMTGIGVAPYSARGLTQTLDPIPQAASTRRTVNGALHDLSLLQFRKYTSVITGTDQVPPAMSGIWPGQLVTVECIAYLGTGSGTPDRPAVNDGTAYTEEGISYFRPVLNMMVTGYSSTTDEWGAQVSWSLTLEEV